MDTIIQHFRKDEQPFIEMATGWVNEVENTYAPKLTGFLDPRQRFILQTISRGAGLLVSSDGCFVGAERQRVLLYPDYYEPTLADYQISVFEIHYPSKFVQLEHRDVLGSLMSLGIDRTKFGDILIEDGRAQMSIASELRDYLKANFESVGKSKVRLELVNDSDDYLASTEHWLENLHIVSSLRLDVIVASLLNCARQKASSLIQGEKVKVNWTTRDQPSFEINELDMISIRGAGRFKVMTIEGRTKKDKIRLNIGKLE
ncbi:RNA-binding protein [Sporosarcina sp. Te-1]|uniref:YlmH family RNA-binding protein n=1 Tax=Sporosarcina sp. Te-1 TaxID=2818390 RepID=UPI001A9D6CCB|nr:RNA-binding protein [Sporosarcina sp. Te-1]QTD42392.1 RNA-binding protein [Sporosarcina sp. Te-1]